MTTAKEEKIELEFKDGSKATVTVDPQLHPFTMDQVIHNIEAGSDLADFASKCPTFKGE